MLKKDCLEKKKDAKKEEWSEHSYVLSASCRYVKTTI